MPKPKKQIIGIRDDVRFGINVKIVDPVNLYGCQIGDDSFVGPFTEIQAGVKIGCNFHMQPKRFTCRANHRCLKGRISRSL